jgi:hypothetical protein
MYQGKTWFSVENAIFVFGPFGLSFCKILLGRVKHIRLQVIELRQLLHLAEVHCFGILRLRTAHTLWEGCQPHVFDVVWMMVKDMLCLKFGSWHSNQWHKFGKETADNNHQNIHRHACFHSWHHNIKVYGMYFSYRKSTLFIETIAGELKDFWYNS